MEGQMLSAQENAEVLSPQQRCLGYAPPALAVKWAPGQSWQQLQGILPAPSATASTNQQIPSSAIPSIFVVERAASLLCRIHAIGLTRSNTNKVKESGE